MTMKNMVSGFPIRFLSYTEFFKSSILKEDILYYFSGKISVRILENVFLEVVVVVMLDVWRSDNSTLYLALACCLLLKVLSETVQVVW